MGNGTNEHCRSFGKGPMSNAGPSPHVQCKVPSQQPTQCLRPHHAGLLLAGAWCP